jgi:hypothetical protein
MNGCKEARKGRGKKFGREERVYECRPKHLRIIKTYSISRMGVPITGVDVVPVPLTT